ncbi:MAG: hypothetical protein JXX28_10050 [Deltaproteobacteria bacterium]|nr:hypothetical protein [Deltaproteobacteria bacterium]
MRTALILALLLAACSPSTKRLSQTELGHYNALKVYMEKADEKAYLKNKTEEERDAWLKEAGLWERFYQYDQSVRDQMIAGEVHEGWAQDQVFMAWGNPHDRKRLTGRPAQRSELFTYRFELQPDDSLLVWRPGSKTEGKAIDLFRVEVYVDDGVVAELRRRDGWTD